MSAGDVLGPLQTLQALSLPRALLTPPSRLGLMTLSVSDADVRI